MHPVQADPVHALISQTQTWYEKLYNLWRSEIDIKSAITWSLIGLLIISIVLMVVTCVLVQMLAPLTRL